MKLGILVTHYNEPWNICADLFDSINMQRGIDFKDIEVVVANDGSENEITPEMLKDYKFASKVVTQAHGGVSKARNTALDNTDADYVMFCDCDDMLLNNYGLHLVFGAMNEGFETLVSAFIEEKRIEDADGSVQWKIINHDKDATFIHGKVHNRKFLIDNELRFDDNLTIHEDGYFNCLAQTIASNKRVVSTPFYLWKWREDSTVRKDNKDYLLKTYKNLMDCRIALATQLRDRGYISEFMDCVAKTVFDSYYDFQKPNACDPDNALLVLNAEREFKRFYKLFGDIYKECNIARIADIVYISRTNAYANGLRIEHQTINEWLTHIVHEVL